MRRKHLGPPLAAISRPLKMNSSHQSTPPPTAQAVRRRSEKQK